MCPLCNGSIVSRHIRRKHLEIISRNSSNSPHPVGAHHEDVGGDCTSCEDIVDVGGDWDCVDGVDCSPGDISDVDLGGDCVSGDIDCVASPESVTNENVNIYGESWLNSNETATTPLYEGAPTTVLHALVKHFHWFSDHPGISKEALSSMLKMEHSLLPPGNNLPCSYKTALSAIEPYLVQPQVFDVCENDCIIFRNEYAQLTECPKCLSPRYTQQYHTSKRHFTYLPLKPRLTRFFWNSKFGWSVAITCYYC